MANYILDNTELLNETPSFVVESLICSTPNKLVPSLNTDDIDFEAWSPEILRKQKLPERTTLLSPSDEYYVNLLEPQVLDSSDESEENLPLETSTESNDFYAPIRSTNSSINISYTADADYGNELPSFRAHSINSESTSVYNTSSEIPSEIDDVHTTDQTPRRIATPPNTDDVDTEPWSPSILRRMRIPRMRLWNRTYEEVSEAMRSTINEPPSSQNSNMDNEAAEKSGNEDNEYLATSSDRRIHFSTTEERPSSVNTPNANTSQLPQRIYGVLTPYMGLWIPSYIINTGAIMCCHYIPLYTLNYVMVNNTNPSSTHVASSVPNLQKRGRDALSEEDDTEHSPKSSSKRRRLSAPEEQTLIGNATPPRTNDVNNKSSTPEVLRTMFEPRSRLWYTPYEVATEGMTRRNDSSTSPKYTKEDF